MSAPVVDLVRAALDQAAENGQPTPGRPALVKLTGATDYRVRKALAEIAATPAPAGEPVSAELAIPGEAGEALVTRPVTQPASPPPESPRRPRPWPLLVIGLGAAVAVWSGWVGLGELTGFGVVRLLPGLWDSLHVNTAVVLPLSVEAYGGYALRCWLGSDALSERTRRFARHSAITSLSVGALAQVAYHVMTAAHVTRAPWPVTVLVACVPVLVLGLASGLAALVKRDGGGENR